MNWDLNVLQEREKLSLQTPTTAIAYTTKTQTCRYSP